MFHKSLDCVYASVGWAMTIRGYCFIGLCEICYTEDENKGDVIVERQ